MTGGNFTVLNHPDKLQILRAFVSAQATLSLALLFVFAIHQFWFLTIAVVLALVMQWVQVFWWAKPSRVSQMQSWLSGVACGLIFKYIILVVVLSLILHWAAATGDESEFFAFFGVFFVVYLLPFWFAGIRQAIVGNRPSAV